MKTLLLSLLVFISLHVAAQMKEAKKVQSVFAAQQYVLIMASSNGTTTYQLTKQKTSRHTFWLLTTDNQTYKVIWDNYQNFIWNLKQDAVAYYMDSLSTKPLPNYATYTVITPSQSITFQAKYINIQKYLCRAGIMPDPKPWGGHP